MKRRKLSMVLALVLVLMLFSTVAYAYVGPQLGSRNLAYGMVGGDVQQVQNILNKDSYSVGNADGIFGSKTLNGVTNFQKGKSLDSDGIVGPLTLKALNNTTSTGSNNTVPTGSNNGGQGSNSGNSSTLPLATILQQKGISASIPNVKIVVNKTNHMLTLYSGSTYLKSYNVDIGDGGLADKQVAGDHKTPEGSFSIVEKSILSPTDQYLGTRWMRLGYPNIEDAQRGLNSGIIDQATYNSIVNATNAGQISPQNTSLGGGIGIHGGNDNNGPSDWTWGCIGLTNADVNEIFNYVSVGTPVIIQH